MQQSDPFHAMELEGRVENQISLECLRADHYICRSNDMKFCYTKLMSGFWLEETEIFVNAVYDSEFPSSLF